MSRPPRAALAALCVLGSIGLGPASSASAAPPTPSAPDWSARAVQSAEALATALDDSARGRPVDARLRSTVASFDELLAHAPLSDRDRARVLYNRGLANLALGNAAGAVLDLRRSDALAPARRDTQRELARARERLNAPPTDDPSTERSLATTDRRSPLDAAWDGARQLDPALRWWVGLSGFAGAWVLLAVSLPRAARPARTVLRAVAGVVAAIGVASMGAVWLEHRHASRTIEAVIVTDDARTWQGPDALAYAPASLGGHEALARGTEVVVIEARPLPESPRVAAWLRVRERGTADTAPAVWIPAETVGWVRPPEPHPSLSEAPAPGA